jgi:hypothetical protein
VHVLAVLASRPPEWDRQRFTAFESRASLDAALSSAEWRAAVDEVTGMGGRRIALIWAEADLLSAGE